MPRSWCRRRQRRQQSSIMPTMAMHHPPLLLFWSPHWKMLILLSFVLIAVVSPSSSSNLFKVNDGGTSSSSNSYLHEPNSYPHAPSKQTRIVGGTPLPFNELQSKYPYMASLQWGTHRCGGTLIAPDLVLTAAHCAFVRWEEESGVKRERFTEEQLSSEFVPSIYTVQLGTIDLATSTTFSIENNGHNNATTKTLVVDQIIMHPLYNVSKSTGPPHPDVAIVKLYGSSKLKKFARLNRYEEVPKEDENVTVLGYGTFVPPSTTSTSTHSIFQSHMTNNFNNDNNHHNLLQSTNVTYLTNTHCQSMGGGALWNYIQKEMICGFGFGKRDSCSGDSGGPLFWEKVTDKEMYQVGIVSWGVGCAHPNYPGVYARISSHYEWIRTQVCSLSKSPPESFDCPTLSSLVNNTVVASPIPSVMSSTPLIVQFQLPQVATYRYGLLVESSSLPLDGNDDSDNNYHQQRNGGSDGFTTYNPNEKVRTLLDIPPGSFSGMSGMQEYKLQVQLGRSYRIVLLNTAGVASNDARLIVKWGDELLVDESAYQGSLQVYSIERHFSIPTIEYGQQKPQLTMALGSYDDNISDAPSEIPSSRPTKLELVLNDRLPAHPMLSQLFGPSSAENSYNHYNSNINNDDDNHNLLMINRGTHTINSEYIATNYGYENGILPMGISITKSFVVLADGVQIMPESEGSTDGINVRNNAITLKDGSYLLGNGGWLIGASSSSLGSSTFSEPAEDESAVLLSAAAVFASPQHSPYLRTESYQPDTQDESDSKVKSEAIDSLPISGTTPPGHGLMVISSTADTMDGFRSTGGSSHDPAQAGGAGMYVMEGSAVEIRGGRFDGGENHSSMDEMVVTGPSLVVDGLDSIVHVHEGTFHGEWRVLNGGTIVIHSCSFSLDSDVRLIQATLGSGKVLNIPFVNDGSGSITSILLEGCNKQLPVSALSNGEREDANGMDVLSDNASPSSTSSNERPGRLPTVLEPTESPSLGTSMLRLESSFGLSVAQQDKAEQSNNKPKNPKSTAMMSSDPLSLQLDVGEYDVLPEDKGAASGTEQESGNNGGTKQGSSHAGWMNAGGSIASCTLTLLMVDIIS